MRRVVESECLDDLPPTDVRAVGSRTDLRRLNVLLGHAGILSRAFRRHREATVGRARSLRLIDLGAGDGTLLLRLARRWSAMGVTAHVTMLDRHLLVSPETRRGLAALDWTTDSVVADVFTGLEPSSAAGDVMLANLFLHHFPDPLLGALLRLAAARATLFIACEPRRSPWALAASRSLRLLGCNAVTRHDATVSVRAGFVARELTALWPADGAWRTSEQPAGLFSHCFVAARHA